MNSWHQLMLLSMARAKYLNLSKRPVAELDWLALWGLIQTMEQVRVET